MGFGAAVLQLAGGALAGINWHSPYYIYLISLLIIPGVILSINGSKKSTIMVMGKSEMSWQMKKRPPQGV